MLLMFEATETGSAVVGSLTVKMGLVEIRPVPYPSFPLFDLIVSFLPQSFALLLPFAIGKFRFDHMSLI